ncbi:MAG: hypothetical protein ACHQUB_02635 [Candidatus Saccharimonadia bacterium]
MRSRRHIATISLAIGVLGNLALPFIASGATSPAPANAPGSGEGLELSPPIVQLSADPGQTIVTNIRIRNITQENLYATPVADDFGAKGENGDPQILLDETQATRYSLKYWIEGMAPILLVPNEIKTASVKIVIPANAEPGGHYGVVRFTATPAGLEGSGVALSASIGTLILLRVNGPVTEKLSLVDMFLSKNGTTGSFFENGPLMITQRISNSGTVHLEPIGSVIVTNMFGKKIASLDINNPPRNILPDSIRRFDETLTSTWMFGRYTASLKVTYGQTNGSFVTSLSFWVIPWKLLLISLVLIIIFLFGLRFAVRRYNQYIIAQARRAKK